MLLQQRVAQLAQVSMEQLGHCLSSECCCMTQCIVTVNGRVLQHTHTHTDTQIRSDQIIDLSLCKQEGIRRRAQA